MNTVNFIYEVFYQYESQSDNDQNNNIDCLDNIIIYDYINNTDYEIDCNAFTRFQYKTVFGRGIFADIKILNEFSEKQEKLRKQNNLNSKLNT